MSSEASWIGFFMYPTLSSRSCACAQKTPVERTRPIAPAMHDWIRPRKWRSGIAVLPVAWIGSASSRRSSSRPGSHHTPLLMAKQSEPAGSARGTVRSIRLLEFEHEFVDRAGRAAGREIARILGVAEEVAGANELEAGSFDRGPQPVPLDPVRRLADGGAVPRTRGVIGDHQRGAWLERGKKLPVHRGAIDRHVGGIVIKEEERDEIEIADVGRQRIIERSRQRDRVLHRRRLHARLKPFLGAGEEARGPAPPHADPPRPPRGPPPAPL